MKVYSQSLMREVLFLNLAVTRIVLVVSTEIDYTQECIILYKKERKYLLLFCFEKRRENARRICYLYGLNDIGEIGKFFSQIELKFINFLRNLE